MLVNTTFTGILFALILSFLLTACASLPPPEPTASAPPTMVMVTATPMVLTATVRLEQSGISVNYPQGWATRVQSTTLLLAPDIASFSRPVPDTLLVALDALNHAALSNQPGTTIITDTAALFKLAAAGMQQAGYRIDATTPITVGAAVGLAADIHTGNAEGRIIIFNAPPRLIRIVGYAPPARWNDERPILEAMVNSLKFFTPAQEPTPRPTNEVVQPERASATNDPSMIFRVGGNAGNPNGRFVAARGLAIAPDGTVALAESGRGVWRFNVDGTLKDTFGANDLLDAYDVAIALDGTLYVADYGRNAIAIFRPDGSFVQRWGQSGTGDETFSSLSPQRIALDANGTLYALDSRVTPNNTVINSILRFKASDGAFQGRMALPDGVSPTDIAVGVDGRIYLADPFLRTIIVLDAQGNEIGRPGGNLNPNGLAAGSLDVAPDGSLMVATWNEGVVKISTDGIVLGRAGKVAPSGTVPQLGEFSLPNGIAAASGSSAWVSDNSGEYSAVTVVRVLSDDERAALLADPSQIVTPTISLNDSLLLHQWAQSATASSQYEGYSTTNVTGPPNTEGCRSSMSTAWAPINPDSIEHLDVDFEKPVFASQVNIYQSHQPGFISSVHLLAEDGSSIPVYTATAQLAPTCPQALEVHFAPTIMRIKGASITLDQRSGANWAEIDAVELVGLQP